MVLFQKTCLHVFRTTLFNVEALIWRACGERVKRVCKVAFGALPETSAVAAVVSVYCYKTNQQYSASVAQCGVVLCVMLPGPPGYALSLSI